MSKVETSDDKASAGWICGAEFDPEYRDGENFVARHLLSLDYDHIEPDDVGRILKVFGGFAHLIYTTASHTKEKPRLRVWLPLSRSAGFDEFQAVSRKVAAMLDIEKAARESHVAAQYMYRPTCKAGGEFFTYQNLDGPWIDVDEILGEYNDWTNRKEWPHRATGDGVHAKGLISDPLTRPGIVGAFNRAFSIEDAILKFNLPYTRVR